MASQLLDASGLYYMRARWYDPANARFVTRDPLSSGVGPVAGGFNYAAANPLTMADPAGLRESTGSDSDGGTCTLACVSLLTIAAARLTEAQAALASARNAANEYLYGADSTIGEGPDGVTVVNNASGVVGALVKGFGFGADNTMTLGSGLIVSSTNIGIDPATNDVLRHEYGHVQQARALGPAYLTTYLILQAPALLDWITAPEIGGQQVSFHDWNVMEIMANDYAHLPLFPSLVRARSQ